MIEEIKNFMPVSQTLATSGQPSEKQIEELKEMEFQVVINLGLLDQPYSLKNEREKVESSGMKYVHIPILFEAPREEQFDEFSKAMDEFRNKKILLHCAANYRASSFAYLHGRLKDGWDKEKAEAFIRKIWEPNPTWRAYLESLLSRQQNRQE